MTTQPQIHIVQDTKERAFLKLEGFFQVDYWEALTQLRTMPPQKAKHIIFDCHKVKALDTFGAWTVVTLWKQFEAQGQKVTFQGCIEPGLSILKEIYAVDIPKDILKPTYRTLANLISNVGEKTLHSIQETYKIISLLGHVTLSFYRYMLKPQAFRYKSFLHFIEETGIGALLIIGLVGFLIGVVLVYQGVYQLEQFGAQIFTVNLLAVSVLRELGILLTAIVVAGRSGSAFTAQIGFMKLNQELDAMKILGIEPHDLLVMPRILALMVVVPLLTLFCNFIALAGGALMSMQLIQLSFSQFAEQLLIAIKPWTFWTGMIKAPIFAFIIGLVACYEGLQVSGGAESVGRHTTQSVVKSIFLVIVMDAIFSVLFARLGI